MTDRRQTWMSALVALAISGCATRGIVDSLETRLRDQEDYAAELEKQLDTVRADLKVARDEVDANQRQLKTSGRLTLVSEQAEVLYRAEGIKFNPLLTSGADLDDQPGDEALSVLLIPVDVHGELIKLVGGIELEVLDLDKPGGEQRVGFWTFTPAEVREHWHRGLMSGGYLFQLPWQQSPTSPELTLHGRMIAPDGRKFSTTTQLKIKLPGGEPSSGSESPPVAQASYEVPATKAAVTKAAVTKAAVTKAAVTKAAVTKAPARQPLTQKTAAPKPPALKPAVSKSVAPKPTASKPVASKPVASNSAEPELAPPTQLRANRPAKLKPMPLTDDSATEQVSGADEGPVETETRRIAPTEETDGPLRTSDAWTDSTIPRLR